MKPPAMGHFDQLRRPAVQIACSMPGNVLRLAGSGAVLSVAEDGRSARVATCAHVLDGLRSDVDAGGRLLVLFPGAMSVGQFTVDCDVRVGTVERAWVHPAWNPVAKQPLVDVAIVEVAGSRIPPAWLEIAVMPVEPGTELAAFGFPSLDDGETALQVALGWYQETGEDGVPICLMGTSKGYSGGAVVSLDTGELVGLLAGGDQLHAHPYMHVARSWLAPGAAVRQLLAAVEGRSELAPAP